MRIKEAMKGLIPESMKPSVRKYYYRICKPLSRSIKRFVYFLPDKIELWRGKRDPLTPPKWMIFVGAGDFKSIGQEFFNYFKQLGRLKPNETVLEVGCGIGRMAVPLTGYLKDGGSYEGFDIVKEGIRWLRENITPRFPNFRFQVADIYNSAYNPCGKHSASDYVFPFENETFDFVFLTSVFTHMPPPDVENYFSEISRVLKKGGRCLITFFLLNEESLGAIEAGRSALDFKNKMGSYRVVSSEVPESAVAFDESYIRNLYAANRMEISEPIRYGSWSGRGDFLSFQDIVMGEAPFYKKVGADQ